MGKQSKRKTLVGCIVLLAALLGPRGAHAQASPPVLVPVQGMLTDDAGVPIEGEHTITLALYDAVTDGKLLYFETHIGVDLTAGRIELQLGGGEPGSITNGGPPVPLSLDVFADNGAVWLQVVVDVDQLIEPRIQLASVPYAANAQTAQQTHSFGGLVPEDDCADGDVLRWSASAGRFRCEPAVFVTAAQGFSDIRLSESDTRSNHQNAAAGTWVPLRERELTFTKRYAGSRLKVTYQDTLGVLGSVYGGCEWRVLLDGSLVSFFSAADGDLPDAFLGWKMENAAHQAWVTGVAAGSHDVTVEVRATRGAWTTTVQCLAGWNQAGNFLSVEEYP